MDWSEFQQSQPQWYFPSLDIGFPQSTAPEESAIGFLPPSLSSFLPLEIPEPRHVSEDLNYFPSDLGPLQDMVNFVDNHAIKDTLPTTSSPAAVDSRGSLDDLPQPEDHTSLSPPTSHAGNDAPPSQANVASMAAHTSVPEITIQPAKTSASQPRNALSAEQKKLLRQERQHKQATIDEDLDSLFELIDQRAAALSEKHSRKPRYFLDRIFNGGVKAITGMKTNSFNAWAHFKCEEVNNREPDRSVSLLDVQDKYADEYHQLSQEDKHRLVLDFELVKEVKKKGPRTTARGKIQDIVNTTKQMEDLITGLDTRVGVQAMFCVVRSSSDFAMKPRWYFSSSDLEKYLEIAVRKRFEAKQVGALMEVYAVAGGSVSSVLRTSKMKADWFRLLIRDKVTELLVEITGNPSAQMQYVNYERDIVQRYHVKMVGWTHEKFVNVSDLGNSLELLETLWSALRNGKCKFIKISAAEATAMKDRTREAIEAGDAPPPKQRKPRKDKGIEKGPRRKKRRGETEKTPEGVASSEEEGSSSADENNGEGDRGRKRART
ncbi:hypothetical protein EW026_g8073 [Hermanssonia centrifuga]|uniref:Uncharacterized protein n=1 Tax=Hermanssonia centrifuga TaxID=98765 RepID=A0A4S4K6N2_9APHY|nr:hypothetical protein EW026_g8073 [Hermanssonia centrifuga]